MAPSGTSRSSFSARGAEFHDRGGKRKIFPRKRNKIRHAFLFDLPRFPVPRHLSRHYLPLTSFSGLHYFLPSTMARLSHSLSLLPAAPPLLSEKRERERKKERSIEGDRQSFPRKKRASRFFELIKLRQHQTSRV